MIVIMFLYEYIATPAIKFESSSVNLIFRISLFLCRRKKRDRGTRHNERIILRIYV